MSKYTIKQSLLAETLSSIPLEYNNHDTTKSHLTIVFALKNVLRNTHTHTHTHTHTLDISLHLLCSCSTKLKECTSVLPMHPGSCLVSWVLPVRPGSCHLRSEEHLSARRVSSWWSAAPILPVLGLLMIQGGRKLGTSCG